MPKINQIRVTNIRYDNGKKQLPDITLKTGGLDTLFLLANGGGKTLIIQLALQTVLPNVQMSGRKISDLLQSDKFTGHVVIEWLLDHQGTYNHYLCTGFCFTDGYRDQNIRYFNYLFDYNEQSNMDINQLPLIKPQHLFSHGSEQPIGYQEFKDWIRDNGKYNIEIIDRKKEYIKRLRNYRILSEEWNNIRKTNGSEGGVDKFFENCKTTQQLMDNLLIPGVEDIIYKSDKQKNELYYAFAKHREVLLEIPVIKKNIKDFEVIRDNSEKVLREVEKLDATKKKFQTNEIKMASLTKTFSAFKEEADRQIIKLNNMLLKLEKTKNELHWKKDSYDVFISELNYKKQLKEFETKNQKYIHQKNELETKEQVYKKIKALYLYNKLKEAEINIVKYEQMLDNVDKSEPELQSKLENAKLRLLPAWKEEKEKLINQKKKMKEKLDKLKNKEKEIEDEIQRLSSEKDNSIKEKGKVENWLEQYEERTKRLKKDISLQYVLDPVIGIKKLGDELEYCRNTKLNIKKRIEEIDLQKDDILKKKEQLNESKSTLLREKDLLKNQIDTFDTEEEKIRGIIAANEKYIKDIFQQKDELLNWINNKFNNARDNRVKLQAEIANVEKIWALIQERDYYIPHHVLLEIKEQLECNNIYCVTGSEWLAAQDINEDQKELYIEYQPLLPYAIIIESTQVKSVKRVMRQLKKLSQDFPVIFIIKNNLKMSSSEDKSNFLEVTSGNFYLYKPDDLGLYISKSKFTQYKNSIEEKLQIKKKDNLKLKEIENILADLKHQIDIFYSNYQKDKIRTWNKKFKEIENKTSDINSQLVSINKNMSTIKKEQKEQRAKLDELEKVIKNKENVFGKIKEYKEMFKKYPEMKEKYNSISEKITSLIIKIKEENKNKEKSKDEQRDIDSFIKECDSQLNKHQNDYEKYSLINVKYIDIGIEIYTNVKQEVDTILDNLEKKQSNRSTIEELLDNYKTDRKEIEKEIEELNIDQSWILENYRYINKSEVNQRKKDFLEQEKQVQKYKEEMNDANTEVEKAKSSFKTLADQLLKHHEKPYYEGFNKNQHNQEIQLINNQLEETSGEENKINKEINNVRRWKQENENALGVIKNTNKINLNKYIEKVDILTQEEWNLYDNNPETVVYKMINTLDDLKYAIKSQESNVEQIFKQYLNDLNKKGNTKLDHFAREVNNIMENKKLFDFNFVETQFIRIFEGLEYYQKQYEKTLSESNENINHLTNLCLRRARLIYESINEIPGNSRVKIFERQLQVIRMNWTVLKEDEGKKKIYDYLNQLLSILQKWKEQGKGEDEINSFMEEMLSSRNLINVIAPIDDCKITVYKPRKESIIKYHRLEYSSWEEVSRWSGGEEYSIYMIMFIIFVTHIREELEGRPNIWKTIMADNPFGRASSSHILEPVFQVAKSNNVQLLCFTAHRQESILSKFPVVYSLQLRSAYGKEIMVSEQYKAENVETGFYKLE